MHVDAAIVRFNIGVGLWKEDSRRGQTVADFLAHFLGSHRAAHEICRAASESTRPVGYPVALGGWRNRSPTDGVLRIGDAAQLADPLTGDGIGNALASGRLVAAAIDAGERRRRRGALAARLRRDVRAGAAPRIRPAPAPRRDADEESRGVRLDARPGAFRNRLHGAVFGATGYRDLI